MTATALAKSFWAKREPGLTTEQWARRYWDSVDAPYRLEVRRLLMTLIPFGTLLEVGCHCGPNLRGLKRDHSGAIYFGMDPSREAIEAGRLFVATEGLSNIGLSLGELPDGLTHIPDGKMDVVLSCYALSYLSPEDVATGIAQMCRVANKAVVIAEPTYSELSCVQRGHYIEWCHDYHAITSKLADYSWTVQILTHPQERLDAIWVGRKQ